MKKNAMLKIAAILMVAVLLTTCAISSTFAKYVSSGDTYSKARVAKWGVKVGISADNSAFGDTYTLDGDTVVSSETYVVAPGTSNANAIVVTLTGKPEVATELTIDDCDEDESTNNFIVLSDWGTECPVEFYIDGTWYSQTGTIGEYQTLINSQIVAAFENTSFDADTQINDSLTIGWRWNYFVDADQDKVDTMLGNLAADCDEDGDPLVDEDGEPVDAADPTIEINFKATIVQVGEETDAVKVTEAVNP